MVEITQNNVYMLAKPHVVSRLATVLRKVSGHSVYLLCAGVGPSKGNLTKIKWDKNYLII